MSGTEQGQEEHGTRSSIGWAAACRKLGWILQEAARSRDEISTRRPADAATRQQQSAAGAPRQTPDAGAPRQPAVSCCRAICGSSRLSSERTAATIRARRSCCAAQLLAGCALLGLLGVHQMQAGPAAGRSALNFPVGTLFGGPANWGRFLAAGGIVDPVGSSSPAAPAATAGMPVARPVALRLPAFAAAPAAPAPILASPPANFGSTDSSRRSCGPRTSSWGPPLLPPAARGASQSPRHSCAHRHHG